MTAARPAMQIEAASEDEVRTTGARFRLADGDIECEGRLAAERRLFRLQTPARFERTAPERFTSDALEVVVRPDSVLELRARRATEVVLDHWVDPVYAHGRRGARIVLDGTGGFGVYPPRPRRGLAHGGPGDAVARYRLRADESLWVAAFPPRPPSRLRASQTVAYEGRPSPFPDAAYPDARIVAGAARRCQVFALHAYFWKAAPRSVRPRVGRYAGRRCSWMTPRHEPSDPERFAALRAAVRRAGMAFVVYVSPYHCTAPDVLAELGRLVAEVDVDGLYLDGVAADLVMLDRIVRRTRALLGPDRVLYLNAAAQPFGTRVFCPFVDAHADFVLRGTDGRGRLPLRTFLRFAVAGWGSSNSVGMWCHYGSSGRVRPREDVPPERHVAAALENHVRLWRRSLWDDGRGALERFDDQYAEGLAALLDRERSATRDTRTLSTLSSPTAPAAPNDGGIVRVSRSAVETVPAADHDAS